MADNYIRKEDVKDALQEKVFHNLTDEFYGAMQAIDELEPADVAPMVHAHWIPQKENHEFKEVWMKCSACGYPVSRWTGNTNFCPNCGAKMDKRRERSNMRTREDARRQTMANISIPITINLPDDWKEQILERVKQDGDWVLVTRCEDCFWHQKCIYEQGLGLDGFCSKGEPKEVEI